jgi:hypothetical protein
MKRFLVSLLAAGALLGSCAMRQAPPVGILAGATPNPMYYFSYAVHQSHPTSCTDGYGMSQPGSAEPDYDTLVGLANYTTSSQTGRVRVYDQTGTLQLWSGVDHKDITLAAGHSIGFSFIRGNPYNDNPIDWKGYLTVESINGGQLVVLGMLAGGGCYPAYWNTYSSQIPVYPGPLVARNTILFPFMNIVWTTDMNHPNGYATGISITNFDTITVTYVITYTVGDGYTGAGTPYSWTVTLAPNTSTSFDVYQQAHAAGYTATLSEGHMSIVAQNANGAPVYVKTLAYMTQADGSYKDFSASYGGF